MDDKLEKALHKTAAAVTTMGIAINIESNAEDDMMFHQIKAATATAEEKAFELSTIRKSAEFQLMSVDSRYIALCAKLHRITGKAALTDPEMRMICLKVCVYTIHQSCALALLHACTPLCLRCCSVYNP